MRPTDLAAEHGISTQAVRNYERDGYLPRAERTASGYRIYTEAHAAALRAYLALIPAYGHETAGQIMTDVHDDDVDHALLVIDRGHQQLLRDRETLAAVENAIGNLMDDAEARTAADGHTVSGSSSETMPWTIGDLAHRLRVTPATLRNWEEVGILAPERNRATGYRIYGAEDIRDAELAHLLRRGGYPLEHIATVVEQVRTVGGTGTLAASLADWRRRLTARGLAMLHSATKLSDYLGRRAPSG